MDIAFDTSVPIGLLDPQELTSSGVRVRIVA
jgi:hypothetical protein